jgi:serine/threonine-protein kinase
VDSDAELRRSVEGRIGSTLRGKYVLEALLGLGGMAAVYRAKNTMVNRACAVKVLHQDVSRITEARDRFLREGRVANTVGHRGAVDVLDGDVGEDGSAFLVMELLEGESVEDRRLSSGGQLDVRTVAAIGVELLKVLGAAHAKGVVHRDVKPANLFLTKTGELKVLDFGIAQLRDTGPNITRTGISMGTPSFMAPEQALGRTSEVGPRSDIWSVGATMFSLLAGRHVHLAETAQEMMILVATKPAPPLSEVVPGVPPPIAAVVDRALAFERDHRWPSAEQMHSALEAAYRAAFGAQLPTLGQLPQTPALAGQSAAWPATVRDPASVPSPTGTPGSSTVEPFASESIPGLPRARVAAWQVALALFALASFGAGGTLAWLRSRTSSTTTIAMTASAPAASSVVAPTPVAVAASSSQAAPSAAPPAAPIPSAAPTTTMGKPRGAPIAKPTPKPPPRDLLAP